MVLSLIIVLSLFVALGRGQCGFPGRPLNGRVFRVEDSVELGAFGQNDLVEEIGEDWNQQELYRVAFRCDNDPLMGSDGEKNRYRDCIDGKWTGENPLCVEPRGKTKIKQILIANEEDNATLIIDEQGEISDCVPISNTEQLNVQLFEKLILFGIRISSGTGSLHAKRFSNANFLFAGDEDVPKIAYKRANLSDSISIFVFNLTEELKNISIKLASNKPFNVCQLEMFAYPNQCGHPEIPINGTVSWQPGSPTAMYYCREGYSLHPKTETRTCKKGKWLGTVPLCKLIQFKTFEDRSKEIEVKTTSTALIIIIVAAISVIVVGTLVLYLYKKNSSSQNRREPEEVDSRERQDVSSDQPNHREPIYATLTFQDRQRGNKLNAEYKQQENVIYAKVEKNKKVKTTEL